jgi:Na+-translocating ferredoxin:NAD+ oxidoreductase RnfG subunit
MNHKIERITKNQTSTLVVLAAVAAVLVTGTAAVGTGHIALADNGNNTKAFKNAGISLPTDTKQKQECQTAGAASLVTGSCTALSTNAVTNQGGVLHEEK